jgi:hypothetical protein
MITDRMVAIITNRIEIGIAICMMSQTSLPSTVIPKVGAPFKPRSPESQAKYLIGGGISSWSFSIALANSSWAFGSVESRKFSRGSPEIAVRT